MTTTLVEQTSKSKIYMFYVCIIYVHILWTMGALVFYVHLDKYNDIIYTYLYQLDLLSAWSSF